MKELDEELHHLVGGSLVVVVVVVAVVVVVVVAMVVAANGEQPQGSYLGEFVSAVVLTLGQLGQLAGIESHGES